MSERGGWPSSAAVTDAYRARSADDRADAVRQLAGLMAATHAELLALVLAVDRERDWAADGCTGPATWLVAACGLTYDDAHEWVRVAHALDELPALRAAYASGRLSWEQVRPATRFATPATDAAVLAEVEGLSARQVALLARRRRPITPTEAQDADDHTRLSIRPDHRRGGIRFNGFLPTHMGAAVAAALTQRAEAMGRDPVSGRWDPVPRRLAHALHDLVTRPPGATGADPTEVATVVVHADAATIDGTIPGNGTIGECTIPRDGVLRALCDARVEVHIHHPDGPTIGVSRARRTLPAWLRRVVSHRDVTCRFPGCERPIRQIHHIRHWARGGSHRTDNLIGLCWAHHTLVHDGGWGIEGDADGAVTFLDHRHRRRWEGRPVPVRDTTVAAPLARMRLAPGEEPP